MSLCSTKHAKYSDIRKPHKTRSVLTLSSELQNQITNQEDATIHASESHIGVLLPTH